MLSDQYLDKEENGKIQDVIFRWLTTDDIILNPIDADDPEVSYIPIYVARRNTELSVLVWSCAFFLVKTSAGVCNLILIINVVFPIIWKHFSILSVRVLSVVTGHCKLGAHVSAFWGRKTRPVRLFSYRFLTTTICPTQRSGRSV